MTETIRESAVFVLRPGTVHLPDGKIAVHDQLNVFASGLLIDPVKREVYPPAGYVKAE